jgi:biopolymer transport protein ExbB
MRRDSMRLSATRVIGFLAAFLLIGMVFKPSNAYAWWNSDWSARKAITVDTSSAGADISDAIGTTPVLIRLDVSNFTFDGANPDGSDLRFVAADDKTLLAYHIEKYDHLLGQAFVWVNVPDLKSEAQTGIFLYYGNKKAAAADDAKGTYDANMVAVYHFGEHGAPARDWTGNGNNAQIAGQADDYSLIGGGLRLDGQTPITLPASSSLAWTAGAGMTWSAWINETALQADAVLYSRTDGTNTVQIGVDNGVPFVAVTTPSGTQRTAAGAQVPAASWHNLAVVANSAGLTLNVDGAIYATLNTPLPALNSIGYVGGDATTGTAAAVPTTPPATTPDATTPDATATPAPVAAVTTGFIGEIEELEISNIARPVGFIKFASVGQGNNPLAGKLINYGVEQKPASWFSGYLVVILGSVTVDGWVIIGILMIMAITSWVVMADKVSYVNRIAKANAEFTAQFSHVAYDLTALDAPAATGVKTMEKSPLYHIYHVGSEEIELRFAGRDARQGKILSATSIAAIRSALDARSVREIQQLNKSMVLLTIAIAGGPFLGLLGTVVGVMITFASIAASGDVNVNAIAPGISAALVATVAGLVVAIPALFGYNYLTSRIRDCISDMQVFVDEFVTKMAEYYSASTVETSQAAE